MILSIRSDLFAIFCFDILNSLKEAKAKAEAEERLEVSET